MMKPKANTANTAKMAKRLLSYIISRYKATFAAVLFCIFVSAGATVASSLFLKTLVDGYITPLLTTGSTDFSGLLRSILTVGVIYLCGVLGTLLYIRPPSASPSPNARRRPPSQTGHCWVPCK